MERPLGGERRGRGAEERRRGGRGRAEKICPKVKAARRRGSGELALSENGHLMVCRARDRYVIGGAGSPRAAHLLITSFQRLPAPSGQPPAHGQRGRLEAPQALTHFPEEAVKARDGQADQGSTPCPQPPHSPWCRTPRTLGLRRGRRGEPGSGPAPVLSPHQPPSLAR